MIKKISVLLVQLNVYNLRVFSIKRPHRYCNAISYIDDIFYMYIKLVQKYKIFMKFPSAVTIIIASRFIFFHIASIE